MNEPPTLVAHVVICGPLPEGPHPWTITYLPVSLLVNWLDG